MWVLIYRSIDLFLGISMACIGECKDGQGQPRWIGLRNSTNGGKVACLHGLLEVRLLECLCYWACCSNVLSPGCGVWSAAEASETPVATRSMEFHTEQSIMSTRSRLR